MATQVGIVKQATGSVIAVDANGNQRILHVGDAIFMGEVVKAQANASTVLSMDNGSEVSVGANDVIAIDSSVSQGQSFGDESVVADLSDLQKAILNGADLTNLEETAAGGNAGSGGAGGTAQINQAYFADGGHYSNINVRYRELGDNNFGELSPFNGVDGAPGDGETLATIAPINPPRVISIDNKHPSAPTNDTTPAIKVDIDFGKVPALFDNNGNFIPADTTDNGDGTWTLIPKDAIDNPNNLNVAATDPNTNRESIPVPVRPNIDVTPPNLTIDLIKNGDTTVTGKTEPGAQVEVTFPNGEKVSVTANDDGSYTAQIPDGVTLSDGNKVTVVAKDEAGNTTTPVETTIDRVAPDVKIDIIKNGDTAVTGTTEPGAKVEVTLPNGVKLPPVTADEKGKYSAELPKDLVLKDGDKVTAVATDPSNNTTNTPSQTIIDRTAPVDIEFATEIRTGDHVNPFGRPVTITLQDKEVDADKFAIKIKDENGNVLFDFTRNISTDGKATFTFYTNGDDLPRLQNINLEVVAMKNGKPATDNSGNEARVSKVSEAVQIEAPVITKAQDNTGSKQGDLTSGAKTDDTTPTIQGTTKYPHSTIGIFDKDGNLVGEGKADPQGNFSIELKTPLTTQGENPLTAAIINERTESFSNDPVKSVSNKSGTFNVNVDTDAPNSITIDLIKNGDTTVTGKTEPGAKVEVTFPNGEKVSVTANDDGSYTAQIPNGVTLSDGNKVTVVAKDEAGNTTTPVETTIDRVAPDVKIDIIKNGDTAVTGTTEPGAKVEVTLPNGVKLPPVTADEKGKYSAELPKDLVLKDGDKVTAVATDPSNNTTNTPSQTIIDRTAPVDIEFATEIRTGDHVNPFGRPVTITLQDKEVDADKFAIKIKDENGNVLFDFTRNISTDGKATFTFYTNGDDLPRLQNINLEVVAMKNGKPATDNSGNEARVSKVSEAVQIEAPVITKAQDNTGSKQGDLTSGAKTDDTTPTIQGTTKYPHSTIGIFDKDGNLVGEGKADPQGNFSIELKTPLTTQGENPLTAAIINERTESFSNDPVKSVSNKSGTFNVNVDTDASDVDVVANRNGDVSVVVSNNDGERLTISYTATDGSKKEAVYTKGANGVWSTTSTDANIDKTSVANANGNQVINIKDAGTQNGTEVKATMVDSTGNEGSDQATAKTPLQAPTITYGEDTDTNGSLTRDESSKDGNTAKTTATVTLSNEAAAGDVLTIKDELGNVIGKYNVVDNNNGNLELQPDNSVDNSQNKVVNGKSVEVPATFNITGSNTDTSASITAEISTTDGSNITQSLTKAISTEKLGDISLDFYEGDHKMPYEDWQNGGATKEQAKSDGDIKNATAKITLPTNIATGDVINIKITDNVDGTISGTTLTPNVVDVSVKVTKNADGTFTFTETTNTGKVGTKTIAPSNGSIVLDVEKVPTHSRDEVVNKFKDSGLGNSQFSTSVKVDLVGSGGEVRSATKYHQIMKDMNELKISYEDDTNKDGTLSVTENFKDGDTTKTNVIIDLPYAAKVGDVVNVEFKVGDEVKENKTITIDADMKKADKITLQAPVESGKSAETSVSITTKDDKGVSQTHKANASVNVDADTAPEKPVITEITDDVVGGVANGKIGKNGVTNDATPTIKGTATAGTEIKVYDGNTLIGTTKADNSGNWTLSTSALKDGSHNITAVAESLTGIKSPKSDAYDINVDTKVGIEIKADGEVVTTDAGNAKPVVTVDGKVVTLESNNGKLYIPKGSLNANSKISATVTDEAGNTAKVDTTVKVATKYVDATDEIPETQNGLTGKMWSWGGVANNNLSTFNTHADNHNVEIRNQIAKTGNDLGTTYSGWNIVRSVAHNTTQVYSFGGTTLVKGAKIENGKSKMYVEYLSANGTPASGNEVKLIVKVDGKEEFTSVGWSGSSSSNGGGWVNNIIFDVPNLNGKHDVEVVVGVWNPQYNRAVVGIIDENGNKIPLGQGGGTIETKVYTEPFDDNGLVYDENTNTYKKPISEVSFVTDSSKTGYDVDGTDNVDTIDHSSSTKGEYIDGKGGNDTIKAGSGNDTIDGGNGADTIDAGAGDDKIVFDQDDTKVDGGAGRDTLIINKDIDFSNISNLDNKVENIEALQLGGDGKAGAVKVTLDANAVKAIKDSSGILEVNGDSDDVLNLKGFSKLTGQNDKAELDKVAQDNNVDQSTHDVYKSTSAGETVYIEVDKMVKVEDVQ